MPVSQALCVANRSQAGTIFLEMRTAADPSVVWRCLTEREHLARWGFSQTGRHGLTRESGEALPADHVFVVESARCRALMAVDDEAFGGPGTTFFIGEEGSETRVSLLQSDFADGDATDEQAPLADARIAAWTRHLTNLGAYADRLAGAENTSGS